MHQNIWTSRSIYRSLFVLFLITLSSDLFALGPEIFSSSFHQDSQEAIDYFNGETDVRSLLLGGFFGLMVIMALYNLLLFFSLRDKAYILYVGTVIFNILTILAINGLGEEYLWPNQAGFDENMYVAFAGVSMAFSSRFAAVFLRLKEYDKRLDQFMWVIVVLSLSMTLLTVTISLDPIYGFARWLVLLSFPSYIVVGVIIYRKGFKPAFFYILAWIPYILGVLVRTIHGANLLPSTFLTVNSIELGGALEVVLLSFALADRIKDMRRQLVEKELEKEQFKTKLLEEQKVVLEQKVEERTKELSEANATKDKFFSIIAHDLRSPMIGLQGVGQKLEYFIKKNRQEKLLEMGGQIDRSLDQLNHLLNNLLNWATSQTGGVPHNPESVDVNDLIEENIQLYKSLAESKEVKLVNEASSLNVYVDSNTTSTIIRNILSNAIKFSPEGEQVTISTGEVDAFGQVIIRDEGKGMTQEAVAKLFEDNVQSKLGASGERGFGLGLKLCKEFVDMNGGTIEVNSVEGNGTTFIIGLPKEGKGILRSIDVA